MKPAFFRSDALQRLLRRAARIAAAPMSLHYRTDAGESMLLLGWGGCAGCAWVNELAEGKRACRNARADAAALAMGQDTPITFVCHLGFSCVSAAALPHAGYLITVGPYLPAGAEHGIAHDVMRGLRQIEADLDEDGELPFTLDDVRSIPAGAVSATVEWLVEAIRDAAADYDADDYEDDLFPEGAPEHTDATPSKPERRAAERTTENAPPPWLALAALALVCGHTKLTRAALTDRVEELQLASRTPPEAMQAFVAQAVSQLLETARRMGGDTETARERYVAFIADLPALTDPAALVQAAMSVLRRVKSRDRAPMPAYLPDLVHWMHTNYKKDIQLQAFSKENNVAASSITRALECRVDGSFTACLGLIRIEQACRLLRNTQLSITAIGRRVGIKDQSNFGKLFLRHTGMNPGAYRKRYQK